MTDSRVGDAPSMPETDWLTGLASRMAFARLVNQADRDRDQFAVVVIAVEDFADVNRQFGPHTGDDLLRSVGRALAGQTSVETMAARLDGARFGVIGLRVTEGSVQEWLRPILSSARAAVDSWITDQLSFNGSCPTEPMLTIGAASGTTGRVWTNASTALDVAGASTDSPAVAVFDEGDPRFAALIRRQRIDDKIATAVAASSLQLAADRIELVSGGHGSGEWLRLASYLDVSDQPELSGVIDTATLPNGLGRRVESWLVERAGGLIKNSEGLRLTLPLDSEAAGGRGFAERLFPILEQQRIPPSRLLFEVSESTLTDAGARGWTFARQVQNIGAGLILTGCEAGWVTDQAMEKLEIAYLRPDPTLVNQAANGNQRARRILGALASNADDAELEMIAPSLGTAGGVLADLGFTYAERPRPPDATG